MIAREATGEDIGPLCAFLNKVWSQRKLTDFEALPENMAFLSDPSHHIRFAVLEDKGEIVAAIGATTEATDAGPGFNVYLVAVDQDRRDKVDLRERLYLWAARKVIAEGSVAFRTATPDKDFVLLRDGLGIGGIEHGIDSKTGKVAEVAFFATLQAIVQAILARHPDWK